MTIIAAADGSSLGNPGPTGWAWYVSPACWAAGGAASGTNNIGELTAVAELLEATAGADEPLRVLCDSQYVINAVTKWMPGWRRRGWRKADGRPVQNRELLERIGTALAGREVAFEWVRGHAGHGLNEAADERARAAASAFAAGREPDAGPGFAAAAAAAEDEGPAPAPPAVPAPGVPAAPAELDLWGEADEPDADGEVIVVPLERELLQDAARTDPARADELLHEDFEELGASGRRYDRAAVLRGLAPLPPSFRAWGFREEAVAAGVRLVRYRTQCEGAEAERASLWCFVRQAANEGAWRLRFHQATPAGPES